MSAGCWKDVLGVFCLGSVLVLSSIAWGQSKVGCTDGNGNMLPQCRCDGTCGPDAESGESGGDPLAVPKAVVHAFGEVTAEQQKMFKGELTERQKENYCRKNFNPKLPVSPGVFTEFGPGTDGGHWIQCVKRLKALKKAECRWAKNNPTAIENPHRWCLGGSIDPTATMLDAESKAPEDKVQ